MLLQSAYISLNISYPKECTFTIFQLLTACIAFGYRVVIRPVHGPIQRARMFPQANLSSDILDLDVAHTPSQVSRSLYRCFACPSPRSTRSAFLLLPFTPDVYPLTDCLYSRKYKVNLNSAFPPPMTYINNESQTNHSERMCVTMESSRTFATSQTSV